MSRTATIFVKETTGTGRLAKEVDFRVDTQTLPSGVRVLEHYKEGQYNPYPQLFNTTPEEQEALKKAYQGAHDWVTYSSEFDE